VVVSLIYYALPIHLTLHSITAQTTNFLPMWCYASASQSTKNTVLWRRAIKSSQSQYYSTSSKV